MKKLSLAIALVVSFFSCKSLSEITPKEGTFEVVSKQNLTLWNENHQSFSLHLQNTNAQNSCELYTVKNGRKKWISPSLLANKSLDFDVPENASVLIENYSTENVKINYSITQ